MKTVYVKNSNHGPRLKTKDFIYDVINQDLINRFIQEYPQYSNEKPGLIKLWGKIASKIREQAINNPLGVILPFYNGELKYQWLPYLPEKIDFNYLRESGEEVPLVDLTHGPKYPKIKWERRNAVRYNIFLQFFGFQPYFKMVELAKEKFKNPNDLRVSRVTLGGKKYGKNI